MVQKWSQVKTKPRYFVVYRLVLRSPSSNAKRNNNNNNNNNAPNRPKMAGGSFHQVAQVGPWICSAMMTWQIANMIKASQIIVTKLPCQFCASRRRVVIETRKGLWTLTIFFGIVDCRKFDLIQNKNNKNATNKQTNRNSRHRNRISHLPALLSTLSPVFEVRKAEEEMADTE